MPIASQEQYEKAKGLVESGQAKDPARLQASMQRWEQALPGIAKPLEEGTGALDALMVAQPNQEPAKLNAAQVQGYNIDLGDPDNNVLQNLANDPKRKEKIELHRQATRDPSLPNASKLKAFNDPPDYTPPPKKNPFTGLTMHENTHYFYEPSLEEFKVAVHTDGRLKRQLVKELGGLDDIDRVIDKDLEQSTAFKAFQDASWKHALADAVKEGKPISRVGLKDERGKSYSKEVGPIEGFQARALDPAMSLASGMLGGFSMGVADPVIRAMAPGEAEEERRSRMRNPNAALGGEILGALSPRGAPARLAGAITRGLGKRLGSKGTQGVVKGLGSAAATGAVDANVRAIAQSAADALDAGDSAVEAAQRIYGVLSPANVAERSVQGGGMGLLLGGAGELAGLGAGKLARVIVGSDTNLPVLSRGQVSGVKMSPTGEPVLPKDLQAEVNAARSVRGEADDLIAERSIDPMLSQRRLEQEGSARRATEETAKARAKLHGSTVPTSDLAGELLAMADAMPAMTPQAAQKRTAIQRYARRLRSRQQLTAQELDDVISEVDSQANQDAKKPDADWNKVSAVLRSGRDKLQFDEPTRVDNYAIRDPEGNVKNTSDYGGMKTRQSREQDIQAFENRQMGLPPSLKAAPVRVGGADPAEAGRFLGDHPNYQQIQAYFNTERAVASDVERSRFSRPKDSNRTAAATQAQYAANKAVSEAVDNGLGYQGQVYRGARMEPEEVQQIISSGKVKSSHMWSTAKEETRALAFAKKGTKGEPVLMEIEGSSGVDLDTVPGLNTFDEVVIPSGRSFRVTDSYRNKDGVLVIKVSDGTRGPSGLEAEALAEGAPPQVKLTADERAGFKGKILGAKDPANSIVTEKIQRLATRAGIPENIQNIQRLHDAQNWKQLLGRAISGVGISGKGIGGSYLNTNAWALRAVPALKSISSGLGSGLPEIEASPKAVDLVERFLEQAVPSTKWLSSRGGQAARPAGAVADRNKAGRVRDTLTDEEAQFAASVIKNLLEMDK